MNRFWDLETIGIHEKEDSNLHNFQDSIYFNNEVRYEARFPFKESHETLPDNYSLCEKQLLYNKLKNKTTVTFLLSKGKQELLRPLKVQALWETATI